MRLLLSILLIWISEKASARVFDLNKQIFAPYFAVSMGPSSVSNTTYNFSSGDFTNFTSPDSYNYSGELGLIFHSKGFAFRVGAEYIRPTPVVGLEGRDKNRNLLLLMNNTVSALAISLMLEFDLSNSNESRWFLGLGGGAANINFQNQYTFKSAGAGYGLSDFTEEGAAITNIVNGTFNYESRLSDNVTIVYTVGYRYLRANQFKHARDTTTFLGAVSSGQIVKNADGSDRAIDLGGGFAGLNFRFYLN